MTTSICLFSTYATRPLVIPTNTLNRVWRGTNKLFDKSPIDFNKHSNQAYKWRHQINSNRYFGQTWLRLLLTGLGNYWSFCSGSNQWKINFWPGNEVCSTLLLLQIYNARNWKPSLNPRHRLCYTEVSIAFILSLLKQKKAELAKM